MSQHAMSTPNKAANPPDCSSPLSSPPPSSVTNRLLDFSPQSSPPVPLTASSSLGPAPATPSPASPPSPTGPTTPTGPDKEQAEARSAEKKQSNSNGRPDASQPPVTTTRSGRRVVRKRPADDSPADERTPSKKASPSAAAVSKRAKREAARWQPASVLSNKRSPLVNFDLRALLCKPEAWTVLDKDEQAAVLALFPQTTDTQTDTQTGASTDSTERPPAIAALANDDNFRHDCARFRSDLETGFFDKAWLADAFSAHAQRSRGVFDAYVIEAFEENWGIPLPDEYRPASVGAANSGQQQEKKDHDANSTEAAKAETPPTELSAQQPALPSGEPSEGQKTLEEPHTAKADSDTGPPVPDDTASVSAPDNGMLKESTKQTSRPRAAAGRRAPAKATAPARVERPARRARSTPTAKPETKAQGRTGKRQKQASPGATAADKAAAFDWEFPDEDETELSNPLLAKDEADADSEADADVDWKPARKAARRAPAKRRASSTVAVRGRKKKTTPSAADEGDGVSAD